MYAKFAGHQSVMMNRIISLLLLCAVMSSCQPQGNRPFLKCSGMKGPVSQAVYRYYLIDSDSRGELEKTVTVSYDEAGRLVGKSVKDADGSQDTDLTIGYEGHVATSLVQTDKVSGYERRTNPSESPTDGHDRIHRTYDRHGYLTSETICDNGRTRTMTNRYDRRDNIVKMVLTDSADRSAKTVTRYRYSDFDSAGNWTVCFSKSDGVTRRIERGITYR